MMRRSVVSAFTLLEVLVATSVLAVVLVLIAQMLAATSATAGESRLRLAADREARFALDRLATDFGRAWVRPDVGFAVDMANGNDGLRFYSEVPGQGSGSPLAAVGYRVTPGRGLERASRRIAWNSMDFNPAAPPAFADNEYRVLAPGVFRFEVAMILAGDYTDPSAPDPLASKRTLTQMVPTGTAANPQLLALTVNLAVLDEDSRRRAGAGWATAAGSLPDFSGPVAASVLSVGDGQMSDPVAEAWSDLAGVNDLGLNRRAASEVRVYSRTLRSP